MKVFLIACGAVVACIAIPFLVAVFLGFNDRDDGDNAV